jgi:hypothetical protein
MRSALFAGHQGCDLVDKHSGRLVARFRIRRMYMELAVDFMAWLVTSAHGFEISTGTAKPTWVSQIQIEEDVDTVQITQRDYAGAYWSPLQLSTM